MIPIVIAFGISQTNDIASSTVTSSIIIGGLFLFGAVFAINSSLHSYLIVSLSTREHVSLDIGFYYMANAMGRLTGTVLSGFIYQQYGLVSCLYISGVFIFLAAGFSICLARNK